MNKLTVILLAFVAFVPFFGFAKKDTTGHLGYLVTLQKDTVRGLIYNHHKHSHTYIVVKNVNNTNKDSVFKPEIVATYFANNRTFKTIILPQVGKKDSSFQFAEILVNGPISLYTTKIKTDFILPPKHAYMAEKITDHHLSPLGKIDYIIPLVEDFEELKNDIINYKYDSSLNSKKLVCEKYNDWYLKNKN